MPPLASTVPSGSRVMFWYVRAKFIGAVSRQLGFVWPMSMTAVRAGSMATETVSPKPMPSNSTSP